MKIFVKRLYAGMLDAFFIGLPVWAVYHIFIGQSVASGDFKISYQQLDFNITTITIGLLILYNIICEIAGQSIGKKIFGLKIKYKGKGIIAKIIRPFIKVFTLYLWPIGIISFFLPKNLLFYDYILKTDIEEIKPEISGGSLR